MWFISIIPILTCFAQTSPVTSALGQGTAPASVTYEGRYVDDHRPGPSVLENRLNITLPAHRATRWTLSPNVVAGQTRLSRPMNFAAGSAVPRELTRVEVGAQFSRPVGQGRTWGLRGSLGYAGDRPFAAHEDVSYGLTGTYGFPGRSGYWVVMVLVANNGVLPNYVPIPGFLYVHRTPRFTGLFGLPILSLTWTPEPRWSWSLSAFGPLVRTELAYGETSRWFVNYALSQQVFIPDRRERARDRLRLQEQRAALGLRRPLAQALTAEVQVGYAFQRAFSITRGFGRRVTSARMPANGFAQVQASYAF